jgi:hypothetical protein
MEELGYDDLVPFFRYRSQIQFSFDKDEFLNTEQYYKLGIFQEWRRLRKDWVKACFCKLYYIEAAPSVERQAEMQAGSIQKIVLHRSATL